MEPLMGPHSLFAAQETPMNETEVMKDLLGAAEEGARAYLEAHGSDAESKIPALRPALRAKLADSPERQHAIATRTWRPWARHVGALAAKIVHGEG
jgi:hypothetical protein